MTAESIEALLVERVAELLQLETQDIDPAAPHAAYGLDSASALLLAAELEDELGIELPDSLAWDHPTLRSLAAHIAGTMKVAS